MLTLIPRLKEKQMMFVVRHIVAVFFFAVLYYLAYKYYDKMYDFHKDKEYGFGDFLYFSLGTQTTIGFGDIYPTHPLTRFITALQLLSVITIIIVAVV